MILSTYDRDHLEELIAARDNSPTQEERDAAAEAIVAFFHEMKDRDEGAQEFELEVLRDR